MMPGAPPAYWVNRFDLHLEFALNHLERHRLWLEKAALLLSSSNLTSSAVILTLMWIALFDPRRPGRLREGYEMIFGSALFAMLATLVARAIAISVPFRARPMAAASVLPLQFPPGALKLIHWSAFPSDHATLFFALAVGILPVSRRLGGLAVAWVVFVICPPILFIGEHWPTDILAGAAIGAGCVQLVRLPAVRNWLRAVVGGWYERRPALVIALFFFWSYEAAVLFEDVRRLLFFFAHKA